MADKNERKQAKEKPKEAKIEGTPKTESSSEAEGAPSSEPTGNLPVEVKTESSSESGE